MTDSECFEIMQKAVAHLLRCTFEDWAIGVSETSKSLQSISKKIGDVE